MWRNFLPINQLPDEEEEEYLSTEEDDPENLVSPTRPVQSPSVSPRALLQPDPPLIDEVLANASRQLRDLPDRRRRAAAVPPQRPVMPEVDFEDENGQDGEGALKDACRSVDKLQWDPNDIKFFFQKFEIKVAAAGVKKQYTKFQVLIDCLPNNVQDEVKTMLTKKATEFPQNDSYRQLKTAILRIFGPKPHEAINRALSRTLVGKPSQLARALVNDICSKDLDCDCCPAVVLALWKRHLPGNVRAGIAHCTFNRQHFNAIIQLADDIFASNSAGA